MNMNITYFGLLGALSSLRQSEDLKPDELCMEDPKMQISDFSEALPHPVELVGKQPIEPQLHVEPRQDKSKPVSIVSM